MGPHVFPGGLPYQGAVEWSGREKFISQFEILPFWPAESEVDLDAWFAVSEMLLPLCHSDAVKDFPLPDGFPSETLDGWGSVPRPDDPDCTSGPSVVV